MSNRPRVMAISAHSSDFIMRCGGTLTKYAELGSDVKVLSLSLGARGEVVSLWKEGKTYEEIRKIRRTEAERAAGILKLDVGFMDWDDHPLTFDTERIMYLAKRIREFRPDILLCHHIDDPTNPDHAAAGKATIEACRYAIAHGVDLGAAPCLYPVIFYFEPNLPAEQANFIPDTFVNISSVFERKMEALGEIRTQPFLVNIFSTRNKYRALVAPEIRRDKKFDYAEAFIRFAPLMCEEFVL